MDGLDIKVKITNKDQVLKIYTDESGFNIPKLTRRALNMTADQVKQALVDEMARTFDRPTPFTLNAPRVKYASDKNLSAFVLFREFGTRSEQYLLVQKEGGQRRLKSFESALRRIGVLPAGMYAVPGRKAPLDAYGNISAGFIVQILSYFKAFGEQGYRANITDEKKGKLKKGTKKKRGFDYFAIRSSDKALKPGIYRKTGWDFRMGIGKTEPMIMFVKQPTYRQLLRWNEIAQKVIDDNWKKNLIEVGMEL